MKTWIKQCFVVGMMIMAGSINANSAGTNTHNREPNHLLGAESPYLKQHVYNAVDWYPWGPEALEKAKSENKPIFLSIGYSTCHWCHVMARESFDNEVIGKYLNEKFVSIKIDRERRPDLDEQFMLVTQVVAGNGGWPNSVFLTADGKPFYAGTYFPPDAFMNILGQVDGLWKKQNGDVRSEGERIATIIRDYMNRTQAAEELTPEAIGAAAKIMLPKMDEFNGGFGVAPKFPQESTLLFMLDQAAREGNRKLLKGVLNALDGMIKGGIHDHLGGGFHRYSVDAEWHVPHFEKMLYNQAMIGRLLVRAWNATGEMRYKWAALRTFDYVLREMRNEKGGFYSAQDADSLDAEGKEGEGYFFIWSPEQVDKVLGDDATFVLNALTITPDGNFEGENVLHMSELPGDAAGGLKMSEGDYLKRLDGLTTKLYEARNSRPKPHRDEKVVVAWNAMMIETLAEASFVFARPDYYDAARKAADYILAEFVSSDGMKRVEFEGSINVDAQLPDYAGMGTALLALHDYAPDGVDGADYLKPAADMAEEVMKRFASEGGGAYRMTATTEGIGSFLPTDDNEIPSGNALSLSLLSGLSKRIKDPKYTQQATLLAAALSGSALESAGTGGYTLLSAHALSHGEAGSVRYLADGAVRVATAIDHKAGQVKFDIFVKEGWHINANKPLEEYFIPTQLSINDKQVAPDAYPDPLVKSLKFNAKPMALYEGNMVLVGEIGERASDEPGSMVLQLQACSDRVCLLPEEVLVRIW